MTGIQIDYAGVTEANRILRTILRELEQLEGELTQLRGAVDPELQARYEVGAKLRYCQVLAEALREGTQKLLTAVESGCASYQELDARLANMTPQAFAANLEGGVRHETDGR